jgi:asparagine synthase (glutamine-hydrolysing)
MCGIAGIYSPQLRSDPSIVERMLTAMTHRGPDDRGVEVVADGHLVLGHLRLSILDLSPLGHQPMRTPDGATWIVYNGEVYNFREIRDDLAALGHTFRSDSDTEVILAAYRAWGLEAVTRFRGMFAFALWDGTKNQLHLCRDRFGVKPLYYAIGQGTLAFASEMKGLISGACTARTVDPASLCEFVQFGYVSAPRSIFSDVQTVEPGVIVTIAPDLGVSSRRYWSALSLYSSPEASDLAQELAGLPDGTLLDRVENSLQEAFAYRMVADVPVGVFLSGGIDSSLVATLLAKRAGFRLKTFTIGFGASEFDESRYAATVASTLGTDHVPFTVSAQSMLEAADEIVDIADEPIGDSSLIPTLLISKLARTHVKVALSADGADELFGGYARYAYCGNFLERPRLLRSLFWLSGEVLDLLPPGVIARAYAAARGGGARYAAIGDKLRKFVRMTRARNEFAAYEGAISEWTEGQARQLLSKAPTKPSDASSAYRKSEIASVRNRFMHLDLVRYLPGDLLVKVDRASMSTSLEAREPFLDHEAARIAAALPMNWKIRGSRNKYVLQMLLERYFPADFFARPKQGFSAPIAAWLRGPLRPVLLENLSRGRIAEFGLLDADAVGGVVRRFIAGEAGSGSAAGIWILLQLQRWAGRWLR